MYVWVRVCVCVCIFNIECLSLFHLHLLFLRQGLPQKLKFIESASWHANELQESIFPSPVLGWQEHKAVLAAFYLCIKFRISCFHDFIGWDISPALKLNFMIIMLPSLPVIKNMGVGERDIGIDSQKIIVLSIRLPLIILFASVYLLCSSTVACGRMIDRANLAFVS